VITNLQIDNFKSLKGLNTNFGLVNFIVGPNAAGKSNFVEALDFISHAVRENLSYAVAEKGGFYNICHRRQRRARGAIAFSVSAKTATKRSTVYSFTLSFQLRTRGEDIRADFYVASEQLKIALDPVDATAGTLLHADITREVTEKGREEYKVRISPEETQRESLNSVQRGFLGHLQFLERNAAEIIKPEPQNLLLSGLVRGMAPFGFVNRELQGVRVFQLNPRLAREPAAPSVHGELGRHGENLASAIDQMRLKDETGFKKLATWFKDAVPSFSKVLTEYTDTRQLGLFFEEEGFGSRWFAEDVSDGTIMSVALFLTLLDKRHKVVVIEEPENCLHPWILRRFLERCREQSSDRQIIITTHSPLAIAQSNVEELYLVERASGVSTLQKATEREPDLTKIIKKDLLDLGQYWLSGGLGAVPEAQEIDEPELFGRPQEDQPK